MCHPATGGPAHLTTAYKAWSAESAVHARRGALDQEGEALASVLASRLGFTLVLELALRLGAELWTCTDGA